MAFWPHVLVRKNVAITARSGSLGGDGFSCPFLPTLPSTPAPISSVHKTHTYIHTHTQRFLKQENLTLLGKINYILCVCVLGGRCTDFPIPRLLSPSNVPIPTGYKFHPCFPCRLDLTVIIFRDLGEKRRKMRGRW